MSSIVTSSNSKNNLEINVLWECLTSSIAYYFPKNSKGPLFSLALKEICVFLNNRWNTGLLAEAMPFEKLVHLSLKVVIHATRQRAHSMESRSGSESVTR